MYNLNEEHCPSHCIFSLIELLYLATCLLLGSKDAILWLECDGESSGGPGGPPVLLGAVFLVINLPLCTECWDMSGGPPVLLDDDLSES